MNYNNFEAIVIGASAGGMQALSCIFSKVPTIFPLPIFVVQHVHKSQSNYFVKYYHSISNLPVLEVNDKVVALPGNIYFAPPDYHMLINSNNMISLSIDEKVNYSRPSIDVLFESAADVYGKCVIGAILTGANVDGAKGLLEIKKNDGFTIVQDPDEAEFPTMPKAAINLVNPHFVGSLKEISKLLFE